MFEEEGYYQNGYLKTGKRRTEDGLYEGRFIKNIFKHGKFFPSRKIGKDFNCIFYSGDFDMLGRSHGKGCAISLDGYVYMGKFKHGSFLVGTRRFNGEKVDKLKVNVFDTTHEYGSKCGFFVFQKGVFKQTQKNLLHTNVFHRGVEILVPLYGFNNLRLVRGTAIDVDGNWYDGHFSGKRLKSGKYITENGKKVRVGSWDEKFRFTGKEIFNKIVIEFRRGKRLRMSLAEKKKFASIIQCTFRKYRFRKKLVMNRKLIKFIEWINNELKTKEMFFIMSANQIKSCVKCFIFRKRIFSAFASQQKVRKRCHRTLSPISVLDLNRSIKIDFDSPKRCTFSFKKMIHKRKNKLKCIRAFNFYSLKWRRQEVERMQCKICWSVRNGNRNSCKNCKRKECKYYKKIKTMEDDVFNNFFNKIFL